MYRDNYFFTPIWREKLNINTSLLVDFIKEVKESNPIGIKGSNMGGWQSRPILPNQFLELKELEDKIEKRVFQISHESGFVRYSQDLKITNLWIDINKKGDSITERFNPGSFLSGIFIVKCSDVQKSILRFFRNQFETFIIEGNESNAEENTIFSTQVKYPSMENGLIIFPSWMSHSVEIGDDEEERITISFNLNYKAGNNVSVF